MGRFIKTCAAVLLAASLLPLCACAHNSAQTPGVPVTTLSEGGYALSDMSGYASLEGYDGTLMFYDLTVADIAQLMEEGKSFAFIAAFAGCPWCNLCMPHLNDAALAEGIEVGYLNTRLDPSWTSNVDIDDYDVFVELFGSYLDPDDAGIPHLYTPHLFCVKDGQVVADHPGVIEGADDPLEPLSEAQANSLVKTYREELSAIR